MNSKPHPLRWGLLSTARINSRFLQAADATDSARVVAVASRSGERASAYAARHGIDRAHGSYEALLGDPTVDAVYVSLPNSLHVEWTIRALEAGKHVLCEKPLGTDPEAVQRAFAVAAERDRLLMEALMWRHTKLARRVCELVREGALGRPALFHSILTNATSEQTDPRLSASLGGGVLADLGCYAIHVFRHLIGEPWRFAGLAVGSGVDTQLAAAWSTRDGVIGQVTSGFGLAFQWEFRVVGDEGWLVMPDRWTAPPCRIEVHVASGRFVEVFGAFDP